MVKSLNISKGPSKKNGKVFYKNKGFYELINTKKYMGDPTKVRYLSTWELAMMRYCDIDPSIVRWSSERIEIPYMMDDGTLHRYYPDLYIEKKHANNSDLYDRWIVEIKPYKEIYPDFMIYNTADKKWVELSPEQMHKNLTPSKLESYEYQYKTFKKNMFKWTKAIEWCKKNGYEFKLLHEHYLKERGII